MPAVDSFIPSPFEVNAWCGCRITIADPQNYVGAEPVTDNACAKHRGLLPAAEVILVEAVERAFDAYKERHDNADVACTTDGCPNRNDNGEGEDGMCADCADRQFNEQEESGTLATSPITERCIKVYFAASDEDPKAMYDSIEAIVANVADNRRLVTGE